MNYLAHAVFSFNHQPILIGNMISDFVKGKTKFNYSTEIQKGIQLHRNIDAFTDNHIATKEAKKIFKPSVGLYAGAFTDVVYDHFIALDKNEFPTTESLSIFTQKTYSMLLQDYSILPEIFQKMILKMKEQDWLYNYQFLWGLEKSFEGVVKRSKYLNSSEEVFILFKENYETFKEYYNIFIKDIKRYAFNEYNKLLTN